MCLTVVERADNWFAVEISAESLSRTILAAGRKGSQINLERALRLGDELGGHIVSGHVDGLARIEAITPIGGSPKLDIRVPDDVSKFIAEKGSVALDGVSLTVNEGWKAAVCGEYY